MKTTIAGLIPNAPFAAIIGHVLLAGFCFLSSSAQAAVDDWPATAYYSPYDPLTEVIEDELVSMALACRPSVNISLDQNGQAIVTPGMLVINPQFPPYQVDIMGPLTNQVTCANIGQELMAAVLEMPTGNVCMSTLVIEDKLKPFIECEDDTIPCNVDILSLDFLEFLIVDDNCDDNPTVYFDYTITDLMCDPDGIAGYVEITYYATDDYGNTNSCDKRIYLEKFGLDDVDFPPDTMINCDGAVTDPSVTGQPTIDSLPIHHFCELIAWKTDNVIPMCSGQTKIIRLWRVMDWCTGETISDPQEILIIDTVPPELICPIDLTLGTSMLQCSASYTLPTPVATDVCSDDALIDIRFGISDIPGIFLSGQQVLFDLGPHVITVTATDDCGNSATCQYTVTVIDDDSPVVVCNNLNITLNDMGMAFLDANSPAFNATDNCGVVSRLVRRMDDNCDTPANLIFGPQVKFCCDDIGQVVMVIFQAMDAAGNTSTCMIQVTIKDGTPPTALCKDACIFLGPNGNVNLPVDSIDNGSFDNCGIVNRQLSKTSYNCTNIGEQVVILTVSDASGNTASCTAIVEVKDTVPPVARCRDITVALNEMGMIVITSGMINNGSTDNCFIDTMYLTEDKFDCSDVGENEIELIVIDAGGLEDTCSATVTVEDMPPMVMCMDVTVYLDEMGDVTITPDDVDGVTDDCSMPTREVTPDTFDCTDVGEVNIVVMTATDDSGNTASCSAIVTVLDTVPPVCNAMDITIELDADGSVTLAGNALNDASTDNCAILTITIDPNTFTCEDTEADVLVVQTVTDVNGNTSTCTASVTVTGGDEPVAECIDITVFLDENGDVSITPDDVDGGSTSLCGDVDISIDTSEFDCDDVGDNIVILTVTAGDVATCTATVTVVDSIPPDCLTQDVTVFLDADGNASIDLGDIDGGISDNCEVDTVVISQTTFDCADEGVIEVTVTVTDVNGNTSTCTADVTVVDDIDPVCVAQDITVTLDGDGNATITAGQINNGSSDNCGPVMLSVNPASFNCDDVDEVNIVVLTVTDASGNTSTCTATVTVEDTEGLEANCQNITVFLNAMGMVVVDAIQVNNGSGGGCFGGDLMFQLSETTFDCSEIGPNVVTLTVTDMMGNTATCTATITVRDNMPPSIICPPNMNADCEDPININNLNQFGTPTTSDNCPPVMVVEMVQDNRNDCGQGTIVRTFTATDPSGNTAQCSQTITIADPDPFDVTDIIWPPAIVNLGPCSSTNPGPGNQPVINAGTCSNVSVSFSDVTMMTMDNDPATPCKEITRTWTVIDSCQLQPGTQNGIFTFVQMITMNDNVGPVFNNINDITVNANTMTCVGAATLIATATDCGMATPITNNFNAGGANASGNFPVGTTTVIFTSSDGCGNISTMEVNVTVIDPNPAQITCIKFIVFLPEELEVDVMPEQFIQFLEGSCTTLDDFLISFSPTDPFDTIATYGCEIAGTVEPVMLYFFDLNGNPIDTCRADIDLRDPDDFCGNGLTITGEIFGENRAMIQNVPVLISEPSMQTVTTSSKGRYVYRNLDMGSSYEIRPFWNVNHKYGVSTLDLAAIQKHLLGIREIESPYKLIAADANNSSSVTISDLLELRRLLLDQIPAFTQNTSWRFVDAHYEFPDQQNPWAQTFPERMAFDPIMEHMRHMDFVAVKVGDVNNTVFLLQPEEEEVDVRAANAMILSIEDRLLKTGETVDIPVSILSYPYLTGYQFALHFDPTKAVFEGLTVPQDGFLDTEWFGLKQVEQGLISTLWYEPSGRVLAPGEVLFHISLRALENMRLSDLLVMSRNTLSPEAYGANHEEILPVHLLIDAEVRDIDFVVFQNVPNPFTSGTILPVQVPESSMLVLEVYAYDGRLVHKQYKEVDGGYHEFSLTADDLEQGGMYYYTISTEHFSGTRKMILLE